MAKKDLSKKNDPQIELLETSLLIPYVRNSRLHSEKQIDQIAASIREFGFINPIIIDSENGLIAGHGRVSAAKKLGLGKVPCIRADHLTEAQKRAYVIADNRLAELASWDNEMLKIELNDLLAQNYKLDILGMDEDYLKNIDINLVGVTEVAPPNILDIESPEFAQMTFTIRRDQKETVEAAVKMALQKIDVPNGENRNGVALIEICEVFINGGQ